jgi:hypothetical protein
VWHWAILAVVLIGAGCGRKQAPDYDEKESRLLVDVLQSLREEQPERALDALGKLRETDPDSRLPDLGMAHEKDRELVVRLNRHLRSGELDEAAKILRYQQRYGDMGTSLVEWADLPDALRGLERYLAGKPYPHSVAMRQALNELQAFRPMLDHSSIFQDFLAAEGHELEAIAQNERDRISRSMLADLDYLVLVDDPRAADILAQFMATVGDSHPLPATVKAVANGDWRTVRELSEPADSALYQSDYLEIAFAMLWDDLPSEVRQALGKGLLKLPPCTLSGLLLHARYAAYYGRMDAAVGYVRELNASVQLSPQVVGDMLTSMVQPSAAFKTPAWRTPCPGVNDFLDRIDQLRASGTTTGTMP